MSKLYIPVLALALVGGSAYGQLGQKAQVGSTIPAFKQSSGSIARMPQGPVLAGASREVIWSDDFSTPSNWAIGTAAGASNDAWVIGTAGPTGEYSSVQVGTIASTTAANGFALFDSDQLCSGNQVTTLTLVNPVDLSSYTGVLFQFEQNYKRYYDNTWIDWSTDGSTWTAVQVNANMGHGGTAAATANPELTQVNVSGAAGSSTVYIRFRFESTPTSVNPLTNQPFPSNATGCAYAWMVDDVAFVTLPDNEIRLNYAYVSTTGTGEEYGRIPVSQVPSALNIGAEIFNFGGVDQTSVTLTTTFSGPTTIGEVSSDVGTLASQNTFVVDENVSLSGLSIGEYTLAYALTSDDIDIDLDPANNNLTRNFEVTQNIYSLDKIGGHAAGTTQVLQQIGSPSFSDNTGLKMMTMYFINNPTTVYGLEIAISANSVAGGQIRVSLLDTADVLNNPSETTLYVDGSLSDWHTLTAADIAAGVVTIEFPNPVSLGANAYYACAEVSGSGTTAITTDPEVYILDDATIEQPGGASMIWLPIDWDDETGTEGNHLYTNGTAFAIRLSFNSSISVAEHEELMGVSLFPNPTNGIVMISTKETGRHTVEVFNTLGETVLTTSITGTSNLDLSAFAKGVYSLRIANGARSTVQRVVLN